MQPIILSLQKPGQVSAAAIQLSLNKGDLFKVKVTWNCHADHQDDVDIHALRAHNDGTRGTISSQEDILSTYNAKKTNKNGVLQNAADGSFSTPCGGLWHSPDIRKQNAEPEIIIIDGSKLPADCNEIPLLCTVHKADHMEEHEADHDEDGEAAFADIEECTLTIMDSEDRVVAVYQLSDEFGEFNVVQAGSLLLGDNGFEYSPVGRGFNGDFNGVLAAFSPS